MMNNNNYKVEILKTKGYGKELEYELYNAYDYYNRTLFNNEMIAPTIKWNNKTYKILGSYKVYSGISEVIEISKKFHSLNDYKTLANTLIHEMIHQYEFQQHGTIGHGSFFKRECNRINKLTGLNIVDKGLGEEEAVSYYRYIIQCTNCGEQFKEAKNVTKSYFHRCGNNEKGKLFIVKDIEKDK